MKTFVTAAGLAAGATAAVLPRQGGCCFQLTASGGQSGQVGQLGDGQNRIGGSYPAGQYCLNGDSITDGNGRGCILTPPTTQFQCDVGATPDSGFSVSGSGELQHNGDSTFYACAAADSEYNIYTNTSEDQTQCVEITLSTGGQCGGSGGGASSASASASQPASSAAPSAPGYSAPASSPVGPESSASATSEASVPGYSGPAPSAPAPSAPAESAPAPSAPAPSGGNSIVTVYTTVCGCSESVPAGGAPSAPGAPSSAPAYSAPAPSAPAPSESAPAPSAPAPSAPVPSAPAPSAPAPSESAPVPSAPAPSAPAPAPSSYPAESESQATPAPSQSSPAAPDSSAPGYPAPSGSAPAPSQSYPAGSQSVPAPSGSAPVPSESAPAPTGYPVPSGSAPAPSESAPVSESAPASTPGGYTTQPATSTQPASSAATGSGSTCATSLVAGSYETPHLIVPVSSNSPDTSYGTSYNAYANSDNSTIFNFDIPQSDEGKTCSLVFLFPKKEDLETTDYTFNGQGSLQFSQLSGAVSEQTSYSSCPSKQQDLGSVTPQPGGSYVVQSGACAAGTTKTIQMIASGGLELEFFEDWNPSPLGLFITVC